MNASIPSAGGRTPRSHAARDRILQAARRVFARNGYDRTTIRVIAAEADINAALVIRYYGSKDELFAAAADFDLRLPPLDGVDRADLGERLVAHFLERWGDGGHADLQLLLRASVSHEAARERMREIFTTQLTHAIAATGDPSTAPARAALVASQMLGLALGLYVLMLPSLIDLHRDDLVRNVGATIQRYLTDIDLR